MKKAKTIIACLAVCLVCSLVVSIGLFGYCFTEHDETTKFAGTYITGVDPGIDAIYLAVTEDGEYTLYKQFEVISTGTWQKDQDAYTYQLTDKNNQAERIAIVEKKLLHLIAEGTQNALDAEAFQKTDDIPVYINLPESEQS